MAEQLAGNKTNGAMASAGTSIGTAVRMLTSDKSKRLLSGILAGGSSMFSSFSRVLRILMLQITGFIFLVIAVVIGSKTFHEYQAYAATHANSHRLYVSVFFCVLFTYFGLSSFWRARK